jgi:hypothetical protein
MSACSSLGALPRLRGRGEQGDIVTPALASSTLCIALTRTGPRPDLVSKTCSNLGSSSRSVHDKAQNSEGPLCDESPCSPRPRKRGSAPRLRLLTPGFWLLVPRISRRLSRKPLVRSPVLCFGVCLRVFTDGRGEYSHCRRSPAQS